ncbi:hypothetical protein [Planctomicrobium piriforme]|uniref:Uncharacterized protein n=1 Tax=Planctomicrobium piriforme TaxID=1576369 RepID=A0A1I3D811_9PLAN|nr:hypothetical protein [Planctomicrobium piriforme]SFH82842.1 hypothetical protein SAMN05421753_103129 [Planctomicrobium piriforme]
MTTSTILLSSRDAWGDKAPPQPIGEILRLLPEAITGSIRMAFEGRSKARGKIPKWLERMADIRLTGFSGYEDTALEFECPTLGDAAPELFRQREFNWSSRPDASTTGFDLLSDVLIDVAAHNGDSERFDRRLLRTLSSFSSGLDGVFHELAVLSPQGRKAVPALLNTEVISTAREMSLQTPKSNRVRVVGVLDMIRASTQAFSVRLDDGQEMRGVMSPGNLSTHRELFEKRVLILGKAVYRPSGRLLRVDADEMLPASDDDTFFSAMPKPAIRKVELRKAVLEQAGKRGVAGIIGKWPGDETDEEIAAALKEMS